MRAPQLIALALFLAACGPESTTPERPAVDTALMGLGTYSELTGFGDNPGALKGYTYVPENMPANAPLVVAFHACSQTAADYQNAGWNALADRLKFYVLYPEQQPANNALRCFNWAGEYGVPTNLQRGQGENQSIIQMINKLKADHSIDAHRVFATGHSGGAAQVSLMLATWPDVFAAGATIAGIAYNCTTTFTQVSTCLSPGIDRTPQEWGDRARAGDNGYSGPYPRITIWQGASDGTVAPMNQTELMEQWTNVQGIDQTADATDTLDGAQRKSYKNAQGQTLVETITIPNMGHGTPVDPSNNCGTAGQYFLDVHICSSLRIAEFFGITTMMMPGDTTPPQVNITAPSNGATVSGNVDITASASDNVGVTQVEFFVNGTLLQRVSAAPFHAAWNTAGLSNGTYALKATAHDAAGNVTSDDDTSVQITGGMTDTTPPTVNVTAPSNGATVSGMVQITADASDNVSVAKVEFLVDGNKVGESSAAPYAFTWNAAGATAGSHAISARAIDAAGNQATDADTMVTIEMMMNPGDTTPPTVHVTSPSSGDTISGIITAKADATDDVGVLQVLLFMDDTLLGSDYHAPYEFLWDTSQFPEGEHTITARAFDAAGNLGQDDSVHITISHTMMNPSPSDGDMQIYAGQRHWGCSTTGTNLDPILLVGLGVVGALLRSRRRRLLGAGLLALLAGCGGEDLYVNNPNGNTAQGQFASASKIFAYLDGKTMTMEGSAIPSHPNGFAENTNYGSATQCYNKVTMTDQANRIEVVSKLGTLKDAAATGAMGTCDHAAMSSELTFDSTAVLIEHVKDNGVCFDFTVTYPGFGQEGRGKMSEDGKTLTLELFFKDQATGHRCADGDVGASTVVLNQHPFTGNALQTYTITQ
ncbi:MAG: PHB depolymerase family esterase [Myxococcota bacterium]